MTRPSNSSSSPPANATRRAGRVERAGAGAEPELEIEVVVGRAPQLQAFGVPVPCEELLRERRAVVGQVRPRRRRARCARRTLLGATSRWPAAPPARHPPRPQCATPNAPSLPAGLVRGGSSSPRRVVRTCSDPCPGGRTRVDATAHIEPEGTGARSPRPTGTLTPVTAETPRTYHVRTYHRSLDSHGKNNKSIYSHSIPCQSVPAPPRAPRPLRNPQWAPQL